MKKQIQMKCVCQCENCKNDFAVLTLIEHSKEITNLTYKEFYNLAETNMKNFENILKENLFCECDKCKGHAKIVEVLDLVYINV